MKIYNSLTRQKEEFKPITPNEVKMYVCGVTVYSSLHIGHIRSYIAYDVISEYFRVFKNYKVMYIRNITDVGSIVGDADEGEDKIVLKAKEMSLHPLELVDINIKGMWQGLDAVRCARPNISPRATGHIIEIIEAVQEMIDKGFAYELDGNVYCDVRKIKDYGKLSGNTLDALDAGARINCDSRKHTPYDFAIWKKAQPTSALKWNSPWGIGYPGWHIECSVMSKKYLGETFDIHGGGRELKFPHHENEIAQSYALCGKDPANYWVHTGMVNDADGHKMSKSLKNGITVDEAIEKLGVQLLRWYFVSSHYGSPVNFSEESVEASKSGLKRIENFFFNLKNNKSDKCNAELDKLLEKLMQDFEENMDDDFNTPNAITAIYDFIKCANPIIQEHNYDEQNVERIINYFKKIDKVFKCFDFLYETKQEKNIENEILQLLEERNKYRQEKNFAKADEIKAQIIGLGAEIFDNKDGTTTFRMKS